MLSYKEFGKKDGKPIIFVHGGFTSSESYQKQYELFPECHAVFVDLPCFGESTSYEHFSFEEAAEGVIELIEKIAAGQKVILIAHSYGGLVAKQIIERRPQIIDKLVVGSTNIKRTLIYWLYTSKVGCVVFYMQNKKRFTREHISYRLVCETQKSAWENFRKLKLQGKEEFETLLLVAQKDVKDIKNSMLEWKHSSANCTMVTIEEADHIYFWSKACEVNELIRNFCLDLEVWKGDKTNDNSKLLSYRRG